MSCMYVRRKICARRSVHAIQYLEDSDCLNQIASSPNSARAMDDEASQSDLHFRLLQHLCILDVDLLPAKHHSALAGVDELFLVGFHNTFIVWICPASVSAHDKARQ